MDLVTLAQAVHGNLIGANREFSGVTTDSRTLSGGELFVAMRGARYDSHDFLGEAAAKGAAAALVSRSAPLPLPAVVVADTITALGRLAGHWRRRSDIPVVAVTGSNGKTTVKEMIGSILGQSRRGLVTEGNLNNHIGVPLTLLRLREDDRFAVVEVAMNHRGEIAYLAGLVQPTVAVINNAAPAHLEGLGNVEAVARAKAEIFEGLREGGVAVINADDPHRDLWLRAAEAYRVVTFGLQAPADVTARFEPDGDGHRMMLSTPAGGVEVYLGLPGVHNVANALAATAAALTAGASLEDVRRGLGKLNPVPGRLEIRAAPGGFRILDDSYNANPGSLRAGLEVLRNSAGEHVLVLGDMAELGDASIEMHADAGRLARSMGVNRLLGVGEFSRHAVTAFGEGGEHFADVDELAVTVRRIARPDVTVLVKGSRRMRMERVVNAVCSPQNPGRGAP